jgi:hypothetical protein
MLLTGRKDESTLRFYEGAGFSREGKIGLIAKAPISVQGADWTSNNRA